MGPQNTLSADLDERKSWFAQRSSAVFPIRLRKNTDLHIVFLNYWKIKNKISQIVCVLRVYNSDGKLVNRLSEPIVENHSDYSIRQLKWTPSQGQFFS